MMVLRHLFTVRAVDYSDLLQQIEAELARFCGAAEIRPVLTEWDATAEYVETNGGDRRVLHYVADVELRFQRDWGEL